MIELRNFIKWVLFPANFASTILWIPGYIIRYYQNRYFRYSVGNYPAPIYKLVAMIQAKEIPRLTPSQEQPSDKQFNVIPESIRLASSKIQIKGDIDWFMEFDDPEDYESLHRWNWAVYLLSGNNVNPNLTVWISRQFSNWVNHFGQINSVQSNGNHMWESYTVSERISNSIVLHHLVGLGMNMQLVTTLQSHLNYLLMHLEYHRDRTGNHIINNSRAIYLYASLVDDPYLNELAFIILEREMANLVSNDGFLREGSSHYQLLFTRWILEIIYFANLCDDSRMKRLLNPYLSTMIKACQFFLGTDGKSTVSQEIQYFGDISPDFPPEWLLHIVESVTIDAGPINNYPDLPHFSWLRLWGEKFRLMSGVPKVNKISGEKSIQDEYPESGWFRIKNKGFSIYLRVPTIGVPSHVGHHHQDMGHITIGYQGIPILVDSGRVNYLETIQTKPESHNTVTIDTLGLSPLNPHRYPEKYFQYTNSCQVNIHESSFEISLGSDGFKRLNSNIVWKRIIRISEDRVDLLDVFDGTGKHVIQSYFHFDENLVLANNKATGFRFKNESISGEFKLHDGIDVKLLNYRGGDNLYAIQSKSYGSSSPSPLVECKYELELPHKMRYSITLDK
jgi:hypothetical protein